MAQYTTGELAKQCQVSVRTVQFYDTKGLLKPSALSDGGRRLYSEEDLQTLHLICMFKAIGFSLETIRDFLASTDPDRILLLLLDEQMKQISQSIQIQQAQLDSIRMISEGFRETHRLPAKSMGELKKLAGSKKKLKKVHMVMLGIGILMDLIQIASIALWIAQGIWWPFACGMPIVLLCGLWMTRLYYRQTDYICPECRTQFKPPVKKFLFSKHTPKTRRLRCPACGHEGYCLEVAAK